MDRAMIDVQYDLSTMIKIDKKAPACHLGFLGLAMMNYALTDYDYDTAVAKA
jgi:hypothetical protein